MKVKEVCQVTIEQKKRQGMVSLPVCVDELYGDIHIKKDEREPLVELHPNREFISSQDFLDNLKLYRLDSKNYCNMYLTKTKVMTAIIIDLFKRLEAQLRVMGDELDSTVRQALRDSEEEALSNEALHAQVNYLKEEFASLRSEAYESKIELHRRQKAVGEASATSHLLKEQELNSLALRSSLSRMIRSLIAKPKALSVFTSVESNPQLLEFFLLQLFRHTRRSINEHLSKLLEVQSKLNVRLGSVRTALLELARLRGEQAGAPQVPDVRLSKILDRVYVRFIKTKINLGPEVQLEDAHIAEYFQDRKYLTYFCSSYLVRKHFFATCIPKELKPVPCIVVLDVSRLH